MTRPPAAQAVQPAPAPPAPAPDVGALLNRLAAKLDALERQLEALRVGRLEKEWYTTEEVAVPLDRAPWTVRQHCLAGRIRATKRPGSDRWVVGRREVERLLNEGLLPPKG